MVECYQLHPIGIYDVHHRNRGPETAAEMNCKKPEMFACFL